MQPTAYLMIGAIAAAFIAGIFSVVNLIISKELKVSEFRQNWIDGLREDISIFISEVETLSRVAEAKLASLNISQFKPGQLSAFRNINKSELSKLSETHRRILLRLNPIEHGNIIASLSEMIEMFYGPCCNIGKIFSTIDRFTAESQSILKNEWKRVKRGEIGFLITKWVFIIFLVSASAIIYLHLN